MFDTTEFGQSISDEELDDLVADLRVDLVNAQYDLRNADFSVVCLIDGDDRLTLNALPNGISDWMDARYIRVHGFGQPTEEESERPRFWRYWRSLPPDGLIGSLIGAWSGNTVYGRVRGDIDNKEFKSRIEHDRAFERELVDDGTLVLKFWFHLPKGEHKERLKQAGKSPHKFWYVDERDEDIFENFDEVIDVAGDYLRETSTSEAPWRVINTTDLNFASVTFARTLLAAISQRLERRTPSRSTAPAAPPEIDGQAGALGTVDLTRRLGKRDYKKKLRKYSGRLYDLTKQASAEGVTTVLAFEGWDAAGKGGVIRRITRAMDVRNYRVIPIAAPTEEEKARHYLWRFWRHLPRAGSTVIFDRSWYGRVLVERVEALASQAEWGRAYAEINDFEAQMVERGYVFLKFWLHLDPDEQLRRFQSREKTPYKKYKITDEDYRNRDRWDDYVRAVNDMVAYTGTDVAPWHLISANNKRWARIRVMKTLCKALKAQLK